MEPNPWLIQLAHEAAAELGFSLAEFTSGGTSDASFIALTGTPVLDGLGPVSYTHLDVYKRQSIGWD